MVELARREHLLNRRTGSESRRETFGKFFAPETSVHAARLKPTIGVAVRLPASV